MLVNRSYVQLSEMVSGLSLKGFVSCSFRYHLPCKFKGYTFLNPTKRIYKLISGDLSRPCLSAFGHTAISCSYDEYPNQENGVNIKGTDFLHLMEEEGICPNYQTYLWLLEVCLNSSALEDGRKLHGKILKLGFYAEQLLSERLIDFYIACANLDGALKVFDDLPNRKVSCWNKIINCFAAKKLTGKVLGLFRQMLAEKVNPDEKTFARVLRACGGNNVPFHYVEQIHSRTITHGFGTSLLVCNPLIDLYSKNGFVDYAYKVFNTLYTRDSVSWVAMVSGLSQNGHEEKAILLFSDMHTSEILPTPYVFSSVLSACAKIELYQLGEQLHGLVFKQGFSSETYVSNALVTLYSRSGNMTSAEKIFWTMWQRDGVSYNSLISGLAQRGFGDRALELFKQMHNDCLKPDCVTVASLLSACASIGALPRGKQLHSYAIKSGMCSDIILEGSLLDLYVKCSDIGTAHEFFLTTKKENVVLWNVMVVAYGQLGKLSESFHIFKQMQISGITPNQFTYPSILKTCIFLDAFDLGEQIHTQVLKTGFQFNMYVCSVLIDMYAKHGKLDTALEILQRLNEEDVVSWTAMIAGYAQHEMFHEALNLFQEMQNRGIQSDNIGFSSAISACSGVRALDQGRQIHAQSYTCGYSDDPSIGNALVSLYARSGKVRQAFLAFEKISEKDSISWNSLISGLAQSGHFEEALDVFTQMNKAGIEINLFTFGSAVSAAANITNIKLGTQIHAMILKTGYDSEIEVCNALITLYSKCGSIDDGKRQFLEMPEKNEVSWNAMITGYSQHGHGNEALDLFEEVKKSGVMPNHVTFVGVLSACSHVGLVNKGMHCFKSMSEEHNLQPRPEHYACVVDILGRAGLLSDARKFIDDMPIKADAMIWRTLLSACISRKNIDIGEVAAGYLLDLEPDDSATYVLLSNMYAVSGKWGCRDRTRQMMKDKGVKKEPGRSWIEIDYSVHAFFVGDQLHPLADKIYEYLGDLNKRAKEIGYVCHNSNLLSEVEQEHRDPKLNTHSEKLAISFGLLSLSSSIPIRVFKNLRVCGDCHNWIKYASEISNRTIIVRDAYRFHHFEGGLCSCRDYW